MITLDSLGSPDFKRDHGLKHAYVAGSMVRGIASTAMVIAMARSGFLGYFGTGALRADGVKEAISTLKTALPHGEPWGMNLLANAGSDQAELDVVRYYLDNDVPKVEASAFMRVTPALAAYRAKGLVAESDGSVRVTRSLLAKLSRPEVAALFLAPAPEGILADLVAAGEITREQADLASRVPLADDICVEADSGGHTDMGVMSALLPAILRLRDQMEATHKHPKRVRVGAAGGIGTPEAAATAYVLGADFVLTGSINQCTVESGASDAVKDILQGLDVQDTDYCPSGSLFELGAKTQVVKKGLFFAARANKLHDLWRQHSSIEDLDPKTRAQIEDKYFKRSFDAVWEETRAYYAKSAPEDLARAEANPKQKMAMIFRWYFVHSMRLAEKGDLSGKVDFQIHCGPAMGAFNQWVKGTELEDWRNRHVDAIALKLLTATADLLNARFAALSAPATVTPFKAVGAD